MGSAQPAKPLFLATHSRSCSTAFERVFIGQPDRFRCIHEPFGDAYYFGPERMSDNTDLWPAEALAEVDKGHCTFDVVVRESFDAIEKDGGGKQAIIKDMAYHIVPPDGSGVTTQPSLEKYRAGAEAPNPTLLPLQIFARFRWAFLIRSPWLAVPSLYRLHVPPQSEGTYLRDFKPKEIGYREMRMLVEHLYPQHRHHDDNANREELERSEEKKEKEEKEREGSTRAGNEASTPIVVDASDLLRDPEGILRAFCRRSDLPFSTSMLRWSADDGAAGALFSKFAGCHRDAMASTGLRARTADEEERIRLTGTDSPQTKDEMRREWRERYGDEAARLIQDAVDLCEEDYRWLKRFSLKPEAAAAATK